MYSLKIYSEEPWEKCFIPEQINNHGPCLCFESVNLSVLLHCCVLLWPLIILSRQLPVESCHRSFLPGPHPDEQTLRLVGGKESRLHWMSELPQALSGTLSSRATHSFPPEGRKNTDCVCSPLIEALVSRPHLLCFSLKIQFELRQNTINPCYYIMLPHLQDTNTNQNGADTSLSNTTRKITYFFKLSLSTYIIN